MKRRLMQTKMGSSEHRNEEVRAAVGRRTSHIGLKSQGLDNYVCICERYLRLPAQGVLQSCQGTREADAPFARVLPQ